MKKKIIMRGLFGLPTGIAIGFVITLIISICIGNGSFYPVTPELIDATGNELNAVILQTVLCAIMGAGFAAASIIWELDSWSLAKQSGIYFMIISVIMLPIAYFTNWMKHTALGVLSYVAIFVAIFVVVWLSQYLLWKRKIKQMNTLVNKRPIVPIVCDSPYIHAVFRAALGIVPAVLLGVRLRRICLFSFGVLIISPRFGYTLCHNDHPAVFAGIVAGGQRNQLVPISSRHAGFVQGGVLTGVHIGGKIPAVFRHRQIDNRQTDPPLRPEIPPSRYTLPAPSGYQIG